PPTPAAAARKFVREWTFADLEGGLSELGRGRSFAAGKELFTVATCASCHKMSGQGGDLGPDLSNLSRRMAERGGRASLLRSVGARSHEIDEQSRTRITVTTTGRTLTGIVKGRDAKAVRIAATPAEPDKVMEVPLADIEEEKESKVSMMPPGLLVT